MSNLDRDERQLRRAARMEEKVPATSAYASLVVTPPRFTVPSGGATLLATGGTPGAVSTPRVERSLVTPGLLGPRSVGAQRLAMGYGEGQAVRGVSPIMVQGSNGFDDESVDRELARFRSQGESLGLQGATLAQFVMAQVRREAAIVEERVAQAKLRKEERRQRKEERELQEKKEEARRQAEAAQRREEIEARRQEEEARRKEERELQEKKEARRKEERELQEKKEEARRQEEEARRKEEEARRKEERELQEKKEEARRKEEEARRKDEAAQRREEREFQERKEEARRQEEEARRRDEAERRQEERRIREEELQASEARWKEELALRTGGTEREPSFDKYRVKMSFCDDSVNIDDYLLHFERTATTHRWSRATWAGRLADQLKGRAERAYLRMTPEDASDYDMLKVALLEEFHHTPEHYRREFRNITKQGDENFVQFSRRLQTLLDQWIAMSQCAGDYDRLYDLILREQLMSNFRGELFQYVSDKKPATAKEAAVLAFTHLESKRDARLFNAKRNIGGQMDDEEKKKEKTTSNGSTKTGVESGKQAEQSEGQVRPVEGSRNKKTNWNREYNSRVICHRCNKTGHIARECTANACMTTEQDDQTKSSEPSEPLCKDCEKIPFRPMGRCKVNGRDAISLRDSGADKTMVKAAFVRPEDYTNGTVHVEFADLDCTKTYPLAWVDVESPYICERILAIVNDNIRPDIFLGNLAQLTSGDWVEISMYPRRALCAAVTTRAQAEAGARPVKPVVVVQIEGLQVTPDQLKVLQQEDETLGRAKRLAKEGKPIQAGKGRVEFKMSRGILKRVYREKKVECSQICVPRSLRKGLLKFAHDTPMAGHLGTKKTRERIWADFYWPGLCEDVRRYCQSCDRCQKVTPKGRVAKVPLGQMPLPNVPFEKVAVDLVGPIKPAADSGARFILVMVDYATRYPEAVALKSIEAEKVAEALWTMWTRLGIPKEVLSDQGGQFTGAVMREVHRLLAVKGRTTTPYHAQCNGLVERFNGTLKAMIKKLCVEDPKTWDRFIPGVLFAYREVPQESTGFSPFELLYGRTVRGPMAILRDLWTKEGEDGKEAQTASEYVLNLRDRIEETCKIAREHLCEEAVRQKKHYDRGAKRRTFEAGDRALLLLPLKKNKLEMAWRGPYVVEERVGECDYRIRIGPKQKLFHANMLKKYVERPAAIATVCVVDEGEEWETVQSSHEDIPLIPLTSEETIEDVHLDPETPELHIGIKEILKDNKDVITDLPRRTSLAECSMRLAHDEPVRVRQFPLPFTTRDIIAKEVDAMLKMGVIEPSVSPYSSPIVIVEKKDGKKRFCSDYRRLNKIVEFDAEPMPNMEAMFAKLSKAKYLSKIDLAKGYWQIPMAAEDKPKTAFTTPQGCYQWTVMPFGLKTSGAIFSRMMRSLLSPLDMIEIDNFIDDILVATETVERHLECLRALFQRLQEASLSARPSKCYLGFKRLEYLGHMVGNGMIQPEEGKMDKIAKMPRPTTKRQIRSFLGLAGFYRRFVPGFADIALPLTDATKKSQPNKVIWTKPMQVALDTLKVKLSTEPVCKLPDFSVPFTLRTDASGVGLGAMLLQDQGNGMQMVACASKKLLPAERNYSTIERECLAVVWGVRKFGPYLYGKPFCIQSDHKPLEYLEGLKATNKRLMRWALALQPYMYTIQAIPGRDNVGADLLSRSEE
ncbi:uncharacterized protein [Littorina saxatilis]